MSILWQSVTNGVVVALVRDPNVLAELGSRGRVKGTHGDRCPIVSQWIPE